MRLAVIGCGAMGAMHARLLAGLPDVTELAVVDVDVARAGAVASECGARPAGHDEALATADAVVIATPAPLHAAGVEAAVARGVPVLCEKPLTDDLGSSEALVALAERSDAHVEMGFQRRHDPAFIAARASVLDGTAGRVHLVRLTAFDPRVVARPAHEWPPTEAAPMFLHSSVHDFDFVRWITGQSVVAVTADGTRRDGARPDDPREIESAVVTLRLDGGSLAVLEASWLHPTGYDIRAEIVADRAHLSMGLTRRTPWRHLDWPDVAGRPWAGYLERFEVAYRNELIAFLRAVRDEQPPASTARDGLEALRIAVAATRSHVERRTVELAEVGARTRTEVA